MRIVEVTTSDISLALLLGPQLDAFVRAGYEVIGVSGPGPFAASLADTRFRPQSARRRATRLNT